MGYYCMNEEVLETEQTTEGQSKDEHPLNGLRKTQADEIPVVGFSYITQ